MSNRSNEYFNKFHKKLEEGKPVFGLVIHNPDTTVAEIVALAGFDFCWIDMEHTALSLQDVEKLIIALELHGCVPLVRVRTNDANAIGQVLDMGARIVAVPHVDTVEDAQKAVYGAKYYPLGRRGYATCSRSTLQGNLKLDNDLMQIKNDETMLLVLIESVEAVRNAHAIASEDGVDILFIGYADLSQDMGITPDTNNPKLQKAVRTVSDAIIKSGKIGSFIVTDPKKIDNYSNMGFNLMICGLDIMLLKNGATDLMKRFRAAE